MQKDDSKNLFERFCILISSLLICTSLQSQINVSWLHGSGGLNSQNTEHITADTEGNIYVYGRFTSTFAVESYFLDAKNGDAFLMRYNNNRTVSWIKQLKNVSLNGIKIADGKLVIYGEFNDSAKIGNRDYVSEGSGDGIVIGLSLYGEILNELIVNGPESESVSGLASDRNQNLFIAATIFPASKIRNLSFQLNNSAMTVLKLDANWSITWHRLAKQQSEYVLAKSVSCSPDGTRITVLGMAGSGAANGRQDSVLFSGSNLTYKFADTYGYFLASLNENGEADHVTGYYGMNHYFVESIAQDNEGNVYLSGSSYYTGYHVTKYSGELVFLWQKNILFHPESWFYSMKVDDDGNIFTTGSFYENINFGDYAVTNNLQGSLFLAKHDKHGELKWTLTASGNKSAGTSLVKTGSGDIYLCGNYSGTMMLQNKLMSSTGDEDFFIARIGEGILNSMEEIDDAGLAVYPNPTAGKVYIRKSYASDAQLTIYSANGSKVYTSNNPDEADISHFPKGTYFMELQSGKGRFVTKIILK